MWDTVVDLASDTAILVHSAGEEVGDFSHIYLGGVDVAENQRGYNLAAISQKERFLRAWYSTHFFRLKKRKGWLRGSGNGRRNCHRRSRS